MKPRQTLANTSQRQAWHDNAIAMNDSFRTSIVLHLLCESVHVTHVQQKENKWFSYLSSAAPHRFTQSVAFDANGMFDLPMRRNELATLASLRKTFTPAETVESALNCSFSGQQRELHISNIKPEVSNESHHRFSSNCLAFVAIHVSDSLRQFSVIGVCDRNTYRTQLFDKNLKFWFHSVCNLCGRVLLLESESRAFMLQRYFVR